MIAVIADDFSGAAELGGIGLRFGLSVQVSTEVNARSGKDLLVIDADTRSVDAGTAESKIENITASLLKLQPEWIYKKTDSVLRGHVVTELKAQMKIMGIDTALLVPANPNLGRTIENGIYSFNKQPVHESSFSTDPEFAITSSRVEDMLKAEVKLAKPGNELTATGIIVGEAVQMEDIDRWAAQYSKNILPAGAAGFFAALLEKRVKKISVELKKQELLSPILFVSGTKFKKNTELIQKIKTSGGPVSYLPATDVNEQLRTHGKAIIAIDPETREKNAVALREETACIVERILRENYVGELFIEGGSTARAIFERLGIKHFYPVQELAPGVVRMKAARGKEFFITVKPGSYAWPEGTI